MTEVERIAQADKDRTSLQFLNFLGGAMGAEQSYAGQDSTATNFPAQYQTVTPFGVAVEGLPQSDKQTTVKISSGLLLLIAAGVALFVLNK